MKNNKLNFLCLFCFTLTMLFSTFLGVNATPVFASSNNCEYCGAKYTNGICQSNSYHYQPAIDSDNDGYYEISNAGNLIWFAERVNNGFANYNAKLVDNINLLGISFTPMAHSYPYSGIFDGNNYTISNLSINSNYSTVGLFGYVENGGIKNLTVQGNINNTNSSTQHVGLIVGNLKDSGFYNCKGIGSVTNNNTSTMDAYIYIGGLVGASIHSVIINCASEVNVNSIVDTPKHVSVGGIVGASVVNGELPKCILNSYSTSNIYVNGSIYPQANTSTNPNGRYFVGGIAGYLNDDAVNNYYFGNITNLDTNTKIIGYAFGKVEPNFSYNSVSGNIIVKNNYYPLGKTAIGVVSNTSYNTSEYTTGLPEALFNSNSSVENSLVSLLMNNKSEVDEIIVAHRDVLGNSSWSELAQQFNGDTIHSFDWVFKNSLSLPVLQDHTFNTNGFCLLCGSECNHFYEDCNDLECNICHKVTTGPNHIYDNCEDTTCNTCDEIREALQHQYPYCDSTICEICGQTRTALQHSYDDCEDAICNTCEKVRVTPGHKTQDCSSTTCLICGKSDIQPVHTYDDCEDSVCNLCSNTRTAPGHIYNNCEDADCERCLKTRTPLSHVYDDCEDTTCNNCSTTREPLSHIVDNCLDTQCNICLKTDIPPIHSYSNCEDTTCNFCNEVRDSAEHVYSDCLDSICNNCSNVRIASGHFFEFCDSTKCVNCQTTRQALAHDWDHSTNPPSCTNCSRTLAIRCTIDGNISYFSTFPQLTQEFNYATFTLLDNVKISNPIALTNIDANVTIDLNGFTISTTIQNEITDGLFDTISDQNIINIIDSSLNKTGAIDYSGNLVDGLGKLNIVNCKFPSGIYVNNSNTLSTIKNENSCYSQHINEDSTEYNQSITIGQHNYTSTTIAPTCTQDGYTEHKCSNCNDTYTTNQVSSLGHTVVILEAKEPTCTSSGKTQGSCCSVCNEVLVEQKFISKLGHNFSVNYSSDDNNHWHACINKGCTEVLNVEAHLDENDNNHCDVCNSLINKTIINNDASNNIISSSTTALVVLGIAGTTLIICFAIVLKQMRNKKPNRKTINKQTSNNSPNNQLRGTIPPNMQEQASQNIQTPQQNQQINSNQSNQTQQPQQQVAQENINSNQSQINTHTQTQGQVAQNNQTTQQNQINTNQNSQQPQQPAQPQQQPQTQNTIPQNNQQQNTNQVAQNNQNTNTNNSPPNV